MKNDDGGPAFPVPSYANVDGETRDSKIEGISLRDYFAGQAMAAMVSMFWERTRHQEEARPGGIVQTTVSFPQDELNGGNDPKCLGCHDEDIAESAYRIAGTMIAVREVAGESD